MLETGPTTELPYDVWLLITEYVADNDLFRLLSVHRAFFDVALARKYSYVEWTKLDEDFIHLLNRLQSPIISSRVRKLYIRVWFIAFLLKRDANFQRHTQSPNNIVSILRSAASSRRLLPCHFDPEFNIPTSHDDSLDWTPITSTKRLSARKAIRFMIWAIRGMTGVREFQLEWTDLPLTQDVKTLLSSIGSTFWPNIRKLTLHAHVLNFRDLQMNSAAINSVEELELHFDYTARPSTLSSRISEQDELLAVVLPLVLQSRSVLRSLIIFSSSSVDLSGFFAALPSMPQLRRFGVAIPFERNILSGSTELLEFLRKHSSNLHHVSISPNLPYSTDTLQVRKKEIWDPVNDELLLYDTTVLSGLESIEIPFVSVDKTIPLLRRSADTLMRLVLTNHTLSFAEVMAVCRVFSHRKQRLKAFYLEAEPFNASQTREYLLHR